MKRMRCPCAVLLPVLAVVGFAVAQETPWSVPLAQPLATERAQERQAPEERAAAMKRAAPEAEIELLLGMQQAFWNRHDLDGFMTGYWNSPDLTFFSGANERHGWQETMDRYKATYQSPGHEMGQLEFSNLRVEALGTDAAFVRGQWHLTMSDGKTPHGLFTLVFRKFADGWKIVHDHTSAAE